MVGEILVHPNGLASNVPKGKQKETKDQQSITLLPLLCVVFIFIRMFRGSNPPTHK